MRARPGRSPQLSYSLVTTGSISSTRPRRCRKHRAEVHGSESQGGRPERCFAALTMVPARFRAGRRIQRHLVDHFPRPTTSEVSPTCRRLAQCHSQLDGFDAGLPNTHMLQLLVDASPPRASLLQWRLASWLGRRLGAEQWRLCTRCNDLIVAETPLAARSCSASGNTGR